MRTFCGPEGELGGDFDVGLVPDAREEGPPALGLTPRRLMPAARAPGRHGPTANVLRGLWSVRCGVGCVPCCLCVVSSRVMCVCVMTLP